MLAEGDFEDAEHGTDGVARILELADGRRFVRLEGLATSDGPDLHVWITDQPSGGEWGSYDDGRYVRLGELKANNGNQNYEIPAEADLVGLDLGGHLVRPLQRRLRDRARRRSELNAQPQLSHTPVAGMAMKHTGHVGIGVASLTTLRARAREAVRRGVSAALPPSAGRPTAS